MFHLYLLPYILLFKSFKLSTFISGVSSVDFPFSSWNKQSSLCNSEVSNLQYFNGWNKPANLIQTVLSFFRVSSVEELKRANVGRTYVHEASVMRNSWKYKMVQIHKVTADKGRADSKTLRRRTTVPVDDNQVKFTYYRKPNNWCAVGGLEQQLSHCPESQACGWDLANSIDECHCKNKLAIKYPLNGL